ncbi:MAG TPA: serine hydrolase [Gemmatimonadales bacterium]|nr:serine hydrolase [Gemmatimonadales bacterium]
MRPFKYLAILLLAGPLPAQSGYFPPRGAWLHQSAAALRVDQARLDSAVAFAIRNESRAPRDQAESQRGSFGAREPHAEIIGPMQDRGDPAGLVIYRGGVIAEWGPVDRVDMTHSVTKTFLSSVLGVAVRDGRIRDVRDTVRGYMPHGVTLFESDHNRTITWDDLLRQTSDWQGSLWGKPDWADRPVGARERWEQRTLYTPGTHFTYNDVRVNVLALAALQVLREPLPMVLRREIMDPIGASSTWRWEGYDNSWIELDGLRMQSVTGGGHWGGGMFINAWDMARLGYLYLNNGRWGTRQLIPVSWVRLARTPGPDNTGYGYMNWFLNPDQKLLPSAPASAVVFLGNGTNAVYVDQLHDLVIVVRWISGNRALDGVIGRVLSALPPESGRGAGP